MQEIKRKLKSLWKSIISLAPILTSIATLILASIAFNQFKIAKNESLLNRQERSVVKMDSLIKEFDSREMHYARVQASKKYPEGNGALKKVMSFFERLSRLHEAKVVTTYDIWFYFRDTLLFYWCGWESWVKKMRIKEGEDPETGELWKGVQTLFEILIEEKKEKRLSEADINNYLEYERNLI